MGRLKPGAKYVYEYRDGITYARELGAPAAERFEIGRTYEAKSKLDNIMEDKLWGDIRRAAKTNPTLQKAMEQCIILYHLSKNKEEPPMWHPV